MVERTIELKRRKKRREKMTQLKAKLAKAKNPHERDLVMQKIHRISPWWTEPQPTK